ncbi:glycine cleavage system aminomethyltransferase GcvT [Luteibaculum oceani]|uniref:Aminomethyltransferase n=1 Tax=Luteibaculum oceani TaxID=1294296 RepID=A0A5C6VAU4_9FLAO|nr:glycine cleavage system aminomethyltransferase GcvT [Luteibaculum oceani]TXC81954.1 glycine cleavage system aminomethyltransferase GcvT [Luteibaculum oceani]
MKKTPLYQKHVDLNAKIIDFGGFLMPVQYEGVNAEHEAVRTAAGVFDVSHMGEFLLEGEGALETIQAITTNNAEKLVDGKAQYTCMPNEQGGIIDDLLVYKMADHKYLLVVNASNIDKDFSWIEKNLKGDAKLTNVSDSYALLAVQGPKATFALQSLTDEDLDAISFYSFKEGKFAGVDNVIISATGYTGAGGFELYIPAAKASEVWDAVIESGNKVDLKPCGLAARDTLRLEMGYCLYGNDITDETSPLEAGLGWITKFQKGDFTAKDIIQKQKEEGVKRKLVGFELVDKGVARQGYDIVDANENKIGFITSGTMSPSMKKAIAMGYVATDFSSEGTEVGIKVRNKILKAKTVKFPFLK